MFLLRQGLALRGHSDENSNLIQLIRLRSIDNIFLKQWIDEKTYLSHDIVNEICKKIYLTIIRDTTSSNMLLVFMKYPDKMLPQLLKQLLMH
jgi:hypothetical protein